MVESEDILTRLKQKDIAAFEKVFHSYYAELCGFAQKYVENKDVAEELVQSMFCSLWEKLDTLDVRTNLKSYLYSGVRNAAFNYFKHQKVVDKHAQHMASFSTIETPVSDRLEVKELKLKIAAAMDLLPDKCRQVFELSRGEHMKYREIADELGISIKTVEIHMGKALKILRRELGTYLPVALLIWTQMVTK